jgi:hypothetical protein
MGGNMLSGNLIGSSRVKPFATLGANFGDSTGKLNVVMTCVGIETRDFRQIKGVRARQIGNFRSKLLRSQMLP